MIRELCHRYYEAWAAGDRDTVRDCLHENLSFVSPQDRYDSAEAFLSQCWRYSEGLTGVEFVEEVDEEGRAFLILRWLAEAGEFMGAEYVEGREGRITRILVVNNDPEFRTMVAGPS